MCTVGATMQEIGDGLSKEEKAELADELDLAYSSICRIFNEHDIYDLGIRKLVPFTRKQGFQLLNHIEARLGRIAFSVETIDNPHDMSAVLAWMSSTGKALSEVSEALENDGRIDRHEAARCRPKVMELMQQCMTILKILEVIEEGNK